MCLIRQRDGGAGFGRERGAAHRESDDLHGAMIASKKAELAVSLAVQIRNKVL
jgi:flagellar hook-basal body complex protein FliE